MADFIRNLLESAKLNGAKSTVVAPICWLLVTLLGGLVGAGWAGMHIGVIISLLVLVFIAVALFIWAFAYFAVRNPDALRSEKYGLTKLAIEQSIKGDDQVGLVLDQLDDKVQQTPPLLIGGTNE